MKKTVVILLLLIYGSATIGATVHLHYCMNKFVGWSLWHGKEDKQCGKCGMKEKKDGCCKDEDKQIRLNTDYEKSAEAPYFQREAAQSSMIPIAENSFKAVLISPHFSVSWFPPKTLKGKLCIWHSFFLI